MKRPGIIWGAGVNVAGFWGPLKMEYNPKLKSWWDSTGDFQITELGLHGKARHGLVTFSSVEEHEVRLWAGGARTVMNALIEWAGGA